MSVSRRFRRTQREKLSRLRNLFGDVMTRDENHGRVDGPEVYKHDGRTAHGVPHLFEDFIYLAVRKSTI